MKVLIAVDDSASSVRAIDFVIHMRWPPGSRVIVLSVVPAGVAQAAVAEAAPEAASDRTLPTTNGDDDFVSRAVGKLRASGLSSEGRVVEGNPPEAIIRIANEERADLLVVGSHGRTGLARLMLGSVSSSTVVHAPCSVLVVKRPKFS